MPPPGGFQQHLDQIVRNAAVAPSKPELAKFDLDFPGGTPRNLVSAIQSSLGRNINVIIPDDLAETKLPALRMSHVDVPQLFAALTQASSKQEAYRYDNSANYQLGYTRCGFRTEGAFTDDSIWYFFVEKPMIPPKLEVCRFYSLAPYLDSGIKVEDITTAVQTGWRMLGETAAPTISFHKDTKLLIAVGDPKKLQLIDNVLKALDKQVQSEPNDPMAIYNILREQTKSGAPASGKPGEPKSEK